MGKRGLREQEEANGFGQLENEVTKATTQFFEEDLLPYTDVKGRILTVAPTEHIHLGMRRPEENLNFIMEKGAIRHLEFESDSTTGQDLRRFRECKTYIGIVYSAPAVTTVIRASNAKVQKKELINGDNIHRIGVVWLRDGDVDKVFKKPRQKIHKGERLRRRDIFPLLLIPSISGDMEMSERIYQGMESFQCEELRVDTNEGKRTQSILYALAIKFLSRNELE